MKSRGVQVSVMALGLILGWTPAVYSHGGRPVPRKFYVDGHGQLQAVLSSDLGIHVTEDDGDSWYWICEDAVGFDVRDFALAGALGDRAGDRVWLVGGAGGDPEGDPAFSGLYRSRDGGCNWEGLVGDFGGHWVSGISVNPDQPSRVIVTTNHPSTPNGIALSDDAGDTWSWVIQGRETRIGSLVRTPSDPSVVYAAATSHLLVSEDDGLTWTERAADVIVEDSDELTVHAVDPEDPRTVYFSALTNAGRVLYVSLDGGVSHQEILRPSTYDFSSATVVDTDGEGGRMIVVGTAFGEVFRSDDGGQTWAQFFSEVESIECLQPDYEVTGDIWVCANPFVQFLSPGEVLKTIGRSSNGAENVEAYFTYSDTTNYRICSDDSQVTVVCGALSSSPDSDDVGTDLGDGGGDSVDGGDAPADSDAIPPVPRSKDSSCECKAGGSQRYGSAWVAAGALVGRRR
jgi:hypothetical protein